MTVAADNQDGVFRLFDELSPHIDGFAVSRVVPIGGCAIAQPDTDVYRRIIYSLYGRHFSDSRIRLRDPFFGPLMKADGIGGFCGCSAGVCGMCVTETGDVYPCRRLPIRLGNIQSDSFVDLYRDHPLMRSLRERALSGKCEECPDRVVCGGSRCIAFALTGDPLSTDEGCIFA
jgi:radical SAM protein with 4Fe4S-binding SPASM domain